MNPLDSAKLQSLALELENSMQFQRAYCGQENRETQRDASGASCGVARRCQIKNYTRELTSFQITMIDTIKLEMYFNDRYDLCPYGLRTRDQMRDALDDEARGPDILTDVQLKEIIMATENNLTLKVDPTKVIETITLVYGKPFSEMSDDEVFGRIAGMEQRIASLNAIKNKPKKLVAQIAAIQDEIETLTELVDSRA